MPENHLLKSRKSDHIRINLEEDVRSGLTTGLENYRLVHRALPETDLAKIDLSQTLFGRPVKLPLLISSMTGGTPEAGMINRRLAEAAQQTGIAMGLGSQRAAIEHPELADTFAVRSAAPDILLFANLGAVQLNAGYGLAECQRAVEMAGADALILHLNPLQEALQPEGDHNWRGLLLKIEGLCRSLPVPVIVKEVGWGISAGVARQLADAGVSAIDAAGAGGTSWSQVERFRLQDPLLIEVADAFRAWGLPTAESLLQIRQAAPHLPVFASGGLLNGVDAAKCLALGATLTGMAAAFLKAAAVSTEAVLDRVFVFRRQLEIAAFASGSQTLSELRDGTRIVKIER